MFVHMNSHTHSHTLETLSGSLFLSLPLPLLCWFVCVKCVVCLCLFGETPFLSVFCQHFSNGCVRLFFCVPMLSLILSLCLYSPRRDCGTVHTLAFADNVQMQRAEKRRAARRPTQDAATSDSTCPHRLVGSWSRCWQRIRRKLCGWLFTVQSGSRLS